MARTNEKAAAAAAVSDVPALEPERSEALEKLRKVIGRQEAAIEEQERDVKSFKTTIENKPKRSPAENKRLGECMMRLGELENLRSELRATFLSRAAKILDLDGLLHQLGTISQKLEDEAKRIEAAAAALVTAARMAKLGRKAIQAINQSP